MLRTLRHIRGLSLFALLVMAGSVPVSFAALLHEGGDDACEVQFVMHDESAHRIGAARTTPSNSPHCFVCHWLQSVQTIITATAFVAPSSNCHHLSAFDLSLVCARAIGQLSARAPPLAL